MKSCVYQNNLLSSALSSPALSVKNGTARQNDDSMSVKSFRSGTSGSVYSSSSHKQDVVAIKETIMKALNYKRDVSLSPATCGSNNFFDLSIGLDEGESGAAASAAVHQT